MKLGLNLSFATKRWLKPENLARMCAEDFLVDSVQFTFDLIDPWWPEKERGEIASAYRDAFGKYGIKIDSAFGGVASYTYAQLLAPTKAQRDVSLTFWKRAIDLTAELGARAVGTPIGGMSCEDAKDPGATRMLYASAQGALKELAAYGKQKGLKEILIEATPLRPEILYTPDAARKFVAELDGATEIPVGLLIDWGHAMCVRIPEASHDMAFWLRTCAPYVRGIHLQQTDGLWDRHWDFTADGLVTPGLIREATCRAGVENIPQYLEVVTIFEDDDDEVLERMKKTMRHLHAVFA
jgi:sugar phosphate isomerase/epimerase